MPKLQSPAKKTKRWSVDLDPNVLKRYLRTCERLHVYKYPTLEKLMDQFSKENE